MMLMITTGVMKKRILMIRIAITAIMVKIIMMIWTVRITIMIIMRIIMMTMTVMENKKSPIKLV